MIICLLISWIVLFVEFISSAFLLCQLLYVSSIIYYYFLPSNSLCLAIAYLSLIFDPLMCLFYHSSVGLSSIVPMIVVLISLSIFCNCFNLLIIAFFLIVRPLINLIISCIFTSIFSNLICGFHSMMRGIVAYLLVEVKSHLCCACCLIISEILDCPCLLYA